jgi:hypothetical protein
MFIGRCPCFGGRLTRHLDHAVAVDGRVAATAIRVHVRLSWRT